MKRSAGPKLQAGSVALQNSPNPRKKRTKLFAESPVVTSASSSSASLSSSSSSSATQELSEQAAAQLAQLDKDGATTKNGWLLADALRHLAAADGGSLVPLMNKHGFPKFYTLRDDDDDDDDASSIKTRNAACPATYLALCRAIVGQQLAGAAVRKIWGRFEEQFQSAPSSSSSSASSGKGGCGGGGGGGGVTPAAFLERAATSEGLEALRAAVGLSNAKARALLDLSEFYAAGKLSDELL